MSEKLLVRILKVGVLSAFIMPIIVTGNSTIFPFVFTKAIYFRILVEFLLIVYAALAAQYPVYRPRRTAIFYLVWALMAALTLSSIFGVDFGHSFWGNYERMTGVFTILHFAALMVIAASVFRTEGEWMPVWYAALAIGTVVGITGLNFLLADDSIMKIGGGGTLGNLIYLANYVMFTVLIAWYAWRSDTRKVIRYAALGVGIIGIAIMMYNGKRGPFIGLLTGGLIGLIAYAFIQKEKKIRQWCVGVLAGFILFAGIAFALRDTRLIQNISVLQGLTHISLTGGTAETRFIAWDIAWKAFKEYPLFGWGNENFYYAFNKFYNPKSLEHGYYETWFDRSHNIFFDYLAMNGIIGFALYIAIFIAVFYIAVKRFRSGFTSARAFLLIVIFFSAFVSQSVFVFDHLSSFLLFFLFLAFADAVTAVPSLETSCMIGAARGRSANPSSFSRWSIIALIAFVMLWMIGRFNLREFKINSNTLLYNRLFNGQLAQALEKYTALVKGNSIYKADVENNFAQAIMGFLQNPETAQKPELKSFWQLAVDGLKSTIETHPLELNGFLRLAELERMGIAYDPQGLDKAEKYYEQGLELSPKRQQILFSWTRLKMERKDYEGALRLLDRAIADNARIADSFWYKAIVLTEMQKRGEAVEYLKQALDLNKSPANFHEAIFAADLLSQFQEFERSILYYEQALRQQPTNARLLITLGQVYARVGSQDKAKEMFDRAQLADPALVEQLKQEIAKQKK